MAEDADCSTYYVLACFMRNDGADITAPPKLPAKYDVWMTGDEIPESEISTPLEYAIEAEDEGMMLPFFDGLSAPLMSRELISSLETCGVDNLQVFDAKVKISDSGETLDSYAAVNIVGLIEAADLAASDYDASPLTNRTQYSTSFDSLTVDEEKVNGALCFRMAESVSTILVHQSVKDVLEPLFPRLSFIKPEDYSN